DFSFDADFEPSKVYVERIVRNMLNNGLIEGALLNVNIPKLPIDEIKGMKICRQANAKWEEEFDERRDPNGKNYYWLTGKFVNKDQGQDTDVWALENNYVSVVPVQFDLTHHHAISFLNQNWNMQE
ncbi:MAG TPA: 5'/3'-nucleotidase SurE, partial [Chitinophagales bacterium]|nr:5'/3'-nucleotidase SurE [Chitinophagales bacterium]